MKLNDKVPKSEDEQTVPRQKMKIYYPETNT